MSSPATKPLIELVNLQKFIFDQVYLNGIHSLQKFELKNLSTTHSVLVKLRSNLTSQIVFQQTNENLPSIEGLEETPYTTNTVASCIHNLKAGYQFNQLFNYVNHIDEVLIEAGKSVTAILSFLPNSKGRSRSSSSSKSSPNKLLQEETNLFGSVPEDDQTFDFFEINGMVFFFAYLCDNNNQPIITNVNDPLVASASIPEKGSSPISIRTPTLADIQRPSSIVVESPLGESIPNASAPDFQLNVKFRSRVCKSFLWSEINDTNPEFDDCILGESYFKDITIWNRSEIDLYWFLNIEDAPSSCLKFVDYETGDPLNLKIPIGPYSPKRVRIVFKPNAIGEFNYDLQLENVNDSGNSVEAHLHAVVRSVSREEILVISSGNIIDFGDCCAGVCSTYHLTLKNVSGSYVEVAFSTENPSVVFQLRPDVDRSGENSAEDEYEHVTPFEENKKNTVSSNSSDKSPAPSLSSSRANSPTNKSKGVDIAGLDILNLFNKNLTTSSSSFHVSDDGNALDDDYVDAIQQNNGGKGDFGGYTRIEELLLRPGSEKVIEVCFRPDREPLTSDYRAGKLTKRAFKISLEYNTQGNANVKERKVIQCKSRVCTSLIDVSPKLIDFGDTDVGTLKSSSIKITNCSDLSTNVQLSYISKVLSTTQDEINIPPKHTVEVKIDIYSRKVNPDYRKQLTVLNLLNRDNDQLLEVRSTNIDKKRVTFHSLFYRILTPTSKNFVDLGAVVLNSPSVRTFTVDNISKKKLTLEILSSLPDEIKIYYKMEPTSPTLAINQQKNDISNKREKILETIGDKRTPKVKPNSDIDIPVTSSSSTPSNSAAEKIPSVIPLRNSNTNLSLIETKVCDSSDYLDLYQERKASGKTESSEASFASTSSVASTATDKTKSGPPKLRVKTSLTNDNNTLAEMLEKQVLSLDSLISLMEVMTGAQLPQLARFVSEEKYVRVQMLIHRELNNLINDGWLAPASLIDLLPGNDLNLVIVYTPSSLNNPDIQGKPRKHDSKVFIRLIDFDRDIEQPQFQSLLQGDMGLIPVRELLLRSSLCRSIMELGQRHINFGLLEKNEKRTKTIIIRNNSETPLLYSIRKSGSIASGDLIIYDGKMGIIRAYGKKEIDFVFDPTLPGIFHEKLDIQNVQDPENNQTLIVKATIQKQSNFSVQSDFIDFGVVRCNDASFITQEIVISNTCQKNTRTFEVKVDSQSLEFKNCLPEIYFDLANAVEEEYFEEVNDDLSASVNDKLHNSETTFQKKRRLRPTVLLSKEVEEEIEHIEQKLKIARRKDKPDKVKKLEKKMQDLRSGTISDVYAGNEIEERDLPSTMGAAPLISDLDSGDICASPETIKKINEDSSPVTPVAAPNVLKFKRTPDSIIFSMEPRQIRTIAVSFRVKSIDISDDSLENSYNSVSSSEKFKDFGSETCSGLISVFECKNTDEIKEIKFQSLVCHDYLSYLKAFPEESNAGETLEKYLKFDLGRTSTLGSRVSLVDNVVESPRASLYATNFPPSPSLNTDPSDIYPQPKVQLELSEIELGRIIIGDKKDCYFELVNNYDFDFEFTVVCVGKNYDPTFTFDPTGVVKNHETLRVYLSFKPESFGRFVRTFAINFENYRLEVNFKWYAISHTYLEFPDLELVQNTPIINIGYCFVDLKKRFSKVTPLTVKNISSKDLYISAVSNLTLQCFIFLSESLESPVVDLFLPKNGQTTVFVALQPYIKEIKDIKRSPPTVEKNNSIIAIDNPLPQTIDSRDLIGGIKFIVSIVESGGSHDLPPHLPNDPPSTNTSLFQLLSQTVKFSSVIGHSIMEVSPTLIDFGVVSLSENILRGKFHVSNISAKLPLSFEVLPLDESITIKTNPMELSGFEFREDISYPYTRQLIEFELKPSHFGLFSGKINVLNLNNSVQCKSIEVRVFVDSGELEILSDNAETSEVFSINWDAIPVKRNPAYKVGHFLSPENCAPFIKASDECKNDRSFNVVNTSDSIIRIVPKSDLACTIWWAAASDIECDLCKDSDMRYKYCGQTILLSPKQKMVGFVSAPKPLSIDEKQILLLNAGKVIVCKGLLFLENIDTGIILKSVNLNCAFGMSIAEVNPIVIDIGKIGHSNSWADVKFSFDIKNIADIPFYYKMDTPDFIRIISNDDQLSNKLKIPVGETQTVNAILKASSIKDLANGPCEYTLSVANIQNPQNDLTIKLMAQATLLELKFERLTQGELVLPSVQHPLGVSGGDSWFAITNISEFELKFEVELSLTPDVADYVTMEVLSRFSNTPLVGSLTLAPEGSLEIRVRAYPKANSRLSPFSSSSKYLLNAEGITFGTLRVVTKQSPSSPTSEFSKTVVEEIHVRGTITEVPIFNILEKRLEFKSTLASDDEDEKKETLIVASENPQFQKRTFTINNISSYALEFNIVLEFPMGFPSTASKIFRISPVDDDLKGVVEANSSLEISVELLDVKLGGVSDDVKIIVIDRNSLSSFSHTVYASIEEDTAGLLSSFVTDKDSTASLSKIADRRGPNNVKVTEEGVVHHLFQQLIPENMVSDLHEEEFSFEYSDGLINEETSFSSLNDNSFSSCPQLSAVSEVSKRAGSLLILKGCKRITAAIGDVGGLFELDLGQQDLSNVVITKKICLETLSSEKVSYRISTLSEADKTWIIPGRFEDTINPTRPDPSGNNTKEIHSISLSIMATVRGVYSTYIIIENVENPVDTKVIRVSMEVVAKKNIRRSMATPVSPVGYSTGYIDSSIISNNVFDVYINGVDAEKANFEMNYLFYGCVYSARSFVIFNRETFPLELQIKTNLSIDDSSELFFSLSRTSLKLFKSLSVEPGSHIRIYLRFSPMSDSPPSGTLMHSNSTVEEKKIEIYINCRLVKDYMKIIPFNAVCRQPQIQVSDNEASFYGTIQKIDVPTDQSTSLQSQSQTQSPNESKWLVDMKTRIQSIFIANTLDDDLLFEVMNDTSYFTVEIADTVSGALINPLDNDQEIVGQSWYYAEGKQRWGSLGVWKLPNKGECVMVIKPNLEFILKNAESLRREKCVIENVIVYNKLRPTEKCFFTLRLGFSSIRDFQTASVSRHSFLILENYIVRFLRDVDSNPMILAVHLVDCALPDSLESRQANELFFRFIYITDQLIHYSTRELAGDYYIQIAFLLYNTLFNASIFKEYASNKKNVVEGKPWSSALSKWVSIFQYFLHFHHGSPLIVQLRELLKRFL